MSRHSNGSRGTSSWQRAQSEEHKQEQEQEQAEDHRVSHPSKAFGARSVNRCQNLIKTDWVLNGIVVHNTHTPIHTATHTQAHTKPEIERWLYMIIKLSPLTKNFSPQTDIFSNDAASRSFSAALALCLPLSPSLFPLPLLSPCSFFYELMKIERLALFWVVIYLVPKTLPLKPNIFVVSRPVAS